MIEVLTGAAVLGVVFLFTWSMYKFAWLAWIMYGVVIVLCLWVIGYSVRQMWL